MHGFGWKCSPVDRSGTEAPPIRDSAAAVSEPAAFAARAATTPSPPQAPQPVVAATAASGKPTRPKGIASARGGKADNLQIISGVGPKLEKTLHGLGFFHFDQIAAWNRDEVDWVDEHLRFKGRIDRDEWISQAKLLADGDMDTFSTRYGTGGLKDKSGKSRSGTRTRKG